MVTKVFVSANSLRLNLFILIIIVSYLFLFSIIGFSQIEINSSLPSNSSISNESSIRNLTVIRYGENFLELNRSDEIDNSNTTYNINLSYAGNISGILLNRSQRERDQQDEGFFEEHPAWNTSDLAVLRLDIQPERIYPGNSTVITATIANIGVARSESSNLTLSVDDIPIETRHIQPLNAGEQLILRAEWSAQNAGIHYIVAQLEPSSINFDGNALNNHEVAKIRVFGEANPQPEVNMELNLDSPSLNAGESHNLTLNLHNPSFVDINNAIIRMYIDGEVIFTGRVEDLRGGESYNQTFSWRKITPGQHVIEARLYTSNDSRARNGFIESWVATVPDTTYVPLFLPVKWVSIGPSLITGSSGLPSGSVGRIDSIAFHPTDPNIFYAGSPFGGLWKTMDGGNSWTPLTDKLPFVGVFTIAVDPKHPEIIYTANGMGIFKSIDGGNNWNLFAVQASNLGSEESTSIGGSRKLVIRYLNSESNSFIIYAATDIGVLRYESNNPSNTKSTASEWHIIKSGRILCMDVNPKDNSEIYISIINDGIYKTNSGLLAKNDNDWQKLTDPFSAYSPQLVASSYYTIDIHWDNPKVMYAAIATSDNVLNLAISRSFDDGANWDNLIYHSGLIYGAYNPFIRVSPKDENLVYFSGVNLYKLRWGYPFNKCIVTGIHDDMHGFEWDPFDQSRYYVGSDGGLWRGIISDGELSCDNCKPLNNGLSVATFYDFDSSKTNPNLMIGGTQDCGTILYQGSPEWKSIAGGDGLYSLIAPGDQVLYSQYQSLDSTSRSNKGAATGWGDWNNANNGLPKDFVMENSWIVLHPNDPSGNYLLSQGDQVYRTLDGGNNWEPIGPKGIAVKGYITRVVVQPQTFTLVAGTSEGQIWYYRGGWSMADENPGAYVTSMAFSPTDYKVLYVSYDSSDPYWRVARLIMQSDGSWQRYTITDNLPAKYLPLNTDVKVLAITGDGYNSNVAYVGTADITGRICGAVFRGETEMGCDGCTWNWKPYNEGLPLVPIKDLLVDQSSKELRAATYGRGAWSIITGSSPEINPPSNLAKISNDPCKIQWQDNSNDEDGFNIYIGGSCVNCAGNSVWTKIASTGANAETYTWDRSCCDVGECTCVMVRAFKGNMESKNSNTITLAPIC